MLRKAGGDDDDDGRLRNMLREAVTCCRKLKMYILTGRTISTSETKQHLTTDMAAAPVTPPLMVRLLNIPRERITTSPNGWELITSADQLEYTRPSKEWIRCPGKGCGKEIKFATVNGRPGFLCGKCIKEYFPMPEQEVAASDW